MSSSSSDTCNSRSLSWLLNPCIPKSPSDQLHFSTQARKQQQPESEPESEPPIYALPDDLLLACLARAPLSSLPSLSAVSRRFCLLLSSPHFFPLRRSLSPLTPTLFSLSLSSHLIAAVHPLTASPDPSATWRISSLPLPYFLSYPTSIAIDSTIFIIGRGSALKLDTWTARISPISSPLFPRKKFAGAALDGKIYVAGGSSRTSAVEIYDPATDTWRTATSESPSRRYGCVGAAAAAGDAFYVAGGLMIGGEARAAHVTAGTVEAFQTQGRRWSVASARVPGGGCIVGACGVGPSLYVVASNAVEITFWRWEEGEGGKRGEWVPLVGPPVGGRVGMGGAVRFSCCAVGEGRMAAAVHVSARGGQNGDFGWSNSLEGAVLVYDVASGEWSRGPDLPVGFRRAGLVCVDC